jgi:hypothetical protein
MITAVATAAASPSPRSNRLPAAPAARRELSASEILFAAADRLRRSQALEASSGAINVGPIEFKLS